MRLPRGLSGTRLATLLRRYGYGITRQAGSHIRLTSTYMDNEHYITIPRHNPLKAGTLNSTLTDVSAYLKMEKVRLIEELFSG